MEEKILVVDDNPDIRMIVKTTLERHGLIVFPAASGFEAIEFLKKDVPHAVVLDVMMPGMSGWEVFDFIKNSDVTSKIPVIMLTARDQAQEVNAGYAYGADYYLTKPCTRQQILRAVGLLLKRTDLVAASQDMG
jgi:CheY-like chemotaxis protein